MKKILSTPIKALFLDRDGIINIDYGYVHTIEDFDFIEGIFSLVKYFVDAGYSIFIVTNQSGIGRGYYSTNDFNILSEWVKKQFALEQIEISEIYHCPHAPEEKCLCRKPKAGMIEQCLAHYNIDLSNSYMIGDKQSDIDFAHQAKIGHCIAIGDTTIQHSDSFFPSIYHYYSFLEKNQGKITL